MVSSLLNTHQLEKQKDKLDVIIKVYVNVAKENTNQLVGSFGSTLNLNEGIISIYYVEKSIKNTTIGYRLENNTLFFQIC